MVTGWGGGVVSRDLDSDLGWPWKSYCLINPNKYHYLVCGCMCFIVDVRTYIHTDRQTFLPGLLGHLSRDDLITPKLWHFATVVNWLKYFSHMTTLSDVFYRYPTILSLVLLAKYCYYLCLYLKGSTDDTVANDSNTVVALQVTSVCTRISDFFTSYDCRWKRN